MKKLLAISIVVLGLGAIHGCNCNDDNGGMMDGGNDAGDDAAAEQFDLAGTMVVSSDGGCGPTGQACTNSSECCTGMCNGQVCVLAMCGADGAPCTNAGDCCNLNCQSNKTCGTAQCVSDGTACTPAGAPCCSTMCVNGTCQALNNSCKTAGNACANNTECCSQQCDMTSHVCASPSAVSFCTQVGDICFHDADCCTGVCTIASGATAGTCAQPPSATACKVDGTVCNGCTGCCSSFCAPFGLGTTKVCQPASGCHVQGDLCHTDSDCCGGDPSQIGVVPGGGLVRCIADPMFPQIGVCSSPNPGNCPAGQSCGSACVPEGDVCHFKNIGGCSVNAIRNDCCNATGNKGQCKLDSLGIPRCYGLTACVMAPGACASSADCCGGVPCLPDSNGSLHCGTASCVPQNGVCTTTADCCTGFQCVVPPGSLKGSCIVPFMPPPPDGGMPPDMAGNPPPMCALFGQACGGASNTPCCTNEGTCLGPYPASMACQPGETDCTCASIIL
jgi:hypothetical protein